MPDLSHLRLAGGWLRRRLSERLDGAARGDDTAGLPPRRLRARVGAPGAEEFRTGGAAAADALLAALEAGDRARIASVLDWGCGAGRVLPHLVAGLREVDAVGVDVDAAAIDWGRTHLPRITFHTCSALPPLPLGDARYDLIYSISVLSHLDVGAQDAWLGELAERLAPGGRLLISTHGPTAFDAFRTGQVRTAWCDSRAFQRGPLAEAEVLHVPYRTSRFTRGDLPGVGEGYGLTFHGPAYIRAHWGARVEIEQIRPAAISGWQDLVVARARA